jgi:hypothetical protein
MDHFKNPHSARFFRYPSLAVSGLVTTTLVFPPLRPFQTFYVTVALDSVT